MKRAEKLGVTDLGDEPIQPDGKRRAYILDSIRHPAEVHLLRSIYQSAFVLVGVVCQEEVRITRLSSKYTDGGRHNVEDFMARDANEKDDHGQHVSKAFHLADVFLDNSEPRYKDAENTPNPNWTIPDELSRVVKIASHAEVVRPRTAETAMYLARGAQMRSACLSRQVGAALVDSGGNIIATGTNEAPRAGGGVYGEGFKPGLRDARCAYSNKYCSNVSEQDSLIASLVKALKATSKVSEQELTRILKNSRITDLLEFSRAVHAEMDALLTATRMGASTIGTRMFVTTYPCHYCARHLVAAGIDEVQFIEPYPKSRATKLHADSITHDFPGWEPPSGKGDKVLFRPFVGIAPRLYERAFLKDRSLKDPEKGLLSIGTPEWGTPWHIGRVSYVQLEADLAREGTDA